MCADNHSDNEHKTKFGKFLREVVEIGKEQIFLNHEILVKDKKIISNTLNSSKEMAIDNGSNSTDSVFFIKIPLINNEQTVEVRLLSSNQLRFSMMNQELNYQFINK